jgi:hypothetical protein
MDARKWARIAPVLAVAASLAFLPGPTLAQTSSSYRLGEHVVNAGGHPDDGIVMTSASFRITFDALGDGLARFGASSPSFRMDGGFAAAYPPPGEVFGLRFSGVATLLWNPERSAGLYNLYRGPLSALSGLDYGSCEEYDISGATVTDSDLPPVSGGFFYLVTAENRLGEEGTKGFDSSDEERPNLDACP